MALFWSARSLPLIIVDNSPNMHNTCYFPDCYLLSVTHGSIRILYLARYWEIFKKPNFQVVKWKSTFIWKMLSQAELETKGSSRLATNFGSPSTPHREIPRNLSFSIWWISGMLHFQWKVSYHCISISLCLDCKCTHNRDTIVSSTRLQCISSNSQDRKKYKERKLKRSSMGIQHLRRWPENDDWIVRMSRVIHTGWLRSIGSIKL